MITYNDSYSKVFYDQIIARAKFENIRDFSDQEIHRVFDDCVLSKMCISVFKDLVKHGLTMDDIENVTKDLVFNARYLIDSNQSKHEQESERNAKVLMLSNFFTNYFMNIGKSAMVIVEERKTKLTSEVTVCTISCRIESLDQ